MLKTTTSENMFRNYLEFIKTFLHKKYRFLIAIELFLILISGIVSGLGIGLYIPVINSFLDNNLDKSNIFFEISNTLISFFGLSNSFINLLVFASIIIILGAFITYITMYLSGFLTYNIHRTVKDHLLNDLLNRPYKYFFTAKTGEIVSILTEQAFVCSNIVVTFFQILCNMVLCLAYIVSLVFISTRLTLLMVVFGFFAVVINQYFAQKIKSFSTKYLKMRFKQANIFTESIQGIKTLKAMGLESFQMNEFAKMLIKEQKIMLNLNNYQQLRPFTNQLVTTLFVSICIFIGGNVLNLTGASVIVFLMVSIRINGAMQALNTYWVNLVKYIPIFEAVVGKLDMNTVNKRPVLENNTPRFIFKESIKLKNIDFSYSASEKFIENLNITIKTNQYIALVGTSGGGKTTIIDLFLGLHKSSRGQILYDGKPLEHYSHKNWCKTIGIVSQDLFLFNDTIANNISYGDTDPDVKRVEEVAKMSFAHDFILLCSDGYDTLLGDRGVKLSGGQRQRIALARALYHKPELLILDEATSSLDSNSEKFIQKALDGLRGSLAILSIAHRLSTIRNADAIYYIEDGNVLEHGSHEELMSQDSCYKKLIQMQIKN